MQDGGAIIVLAEPEWESYVLVPVLVVRTVVVLLLVEDNSDDNNESRVEQSRVEYGLAGVTAASPYGSGRGRGVWVGRRDRSQPLREWEGKGGMGWLVLYESLQRARARRRMVLQRRGWPCGGRCTSKTRSA